MFGYSQKELVGKNVASIVPEPMASMHQRFLTKYMETGDKHFLGTTRTVLGMKKGGDIIPIVQTTTSMENSFAGLFQVIHRLLDATTSVKKYLPRLCRRMRISSFLPAIPWWPLLPALRVYK